jgi:hypothetical protein
VQHAFVLLACTLIKFQSLGSSELVQRVAIDEIAESMMAFNTNYKDTGLFGVYAVAKVWWTFFLFLLTIWKIRVLAYQSKEWKDCKQY